MSNIERVWKREQQVEAETRRIEQLRKVCHAPTFNPEASEALMNGPLHLIKEIDDQRKIEDIQRHAIEMGHTKSVFVIASAHDEHRASAITLTCVRGHVSCGVMCVCVRVCLCHMRACIRPCTEQKEGRSHRLDVPRPVRQPRRVSPGPQD